MKGSTRFTEIITTLDRIIDRSIRQNSPAALFAYLYRRTNLEIKKACEDDYFENSDRMLEMLAVFSQLYIQAYKAFEQGNKGPKSWQVHFCGTQKLSAIQHILMGMNAHINLDLAIAAAQVMPKKDRHSFHADFMKVNHILRGLIDEMQERLSQGSPLLSLVDRWMGRMDEWLVDGLMKGFRSRAWMAACRLAKAEKTLEKKLLIRQLDEKVSYWAKWIVQPPSLLNLWFKLVRIFEEKKISTLINKLQMTVVLSR